MNTANSQLVGPSSGIFFTSDTHYGHANIIKYCDRPFTSVEEMQETLIENWNSVVGDDDVVYHLGDVFFCDKGHAKSIMHRLKGRKRVIHGNHDKLLRRNKDVLELFEEALPDLAEITIDGIKVVLCHYPMLTWDQSHRGSFNLHGHTHGQIPFDPKVRRLDVGVDVHGFTPISWADVRRKLEAVPLHNYKQREM